LTKDSERKQHRFYDVEEFRRAHLAALKPAGRLEKLLGRVTDPLDSFQGIIIVMMALPIVFGAVAAVTIGISYGPLGFLGIFGLLIGRIAFFAERRVGQSMQFGEYKLFRRMLAQMLAFLILGGIIFGLILLSRFKLF